MIVKQKEILLCPCGAVYHAEDVRKPAFGHCPRDGKKLEAKLMEDHLSCPQDTNHNETIEHIIRENPEMIDHINNCPVCGVEVTHNTEMKPIPIKAGC